jgi:hypothetical protein
MSNEITGNCNDLSICIYEEFGSKTPSQNAKSKISELTTP